MGQSTWNLEALRTAVRNGCIQWHCHALERMAERRITTEQLKDAMRDGELIEDCADAYPLPAALFLSQDAHRPLHVVVAFDERGMTGYIITAYEPTLEHFEPDFRTRRKR